VIIGIGSDILDIRRMEKAIERHGERLIQRVFTKVEQAKAESRKGSAPRNNRITTLAKRFAAKEACAKALGTGFQHGVFHKDMGVVNLPSGQPSLQLTGGAAARLSALTPPGYKAVIHLTLTDEYPTAQAFVMIEVLPILS
jgi:holo-[acyl-carrier protein] synthase